MEKPKECTLFGLFPSFVNVLSPAMYLYNFVIIWVVVPGFKSCYSSILIGGGKGKGFYLIKKKL